MPSAPELNRTVTISWALLISIIIGVFWTGYFYFEISTLRDKLTNEIQIVSERVDKRYERQEEKNTTFFRLINSEKEGRYETKDRVLVLETLNSVLPPHIMPKDNTLKEINISAPEEK